MSTITKILEKLDFRYIQSIVDTRVDWIEASFMQTLKKISVNSEKDFLEVSSRYFQFLQSGFLGSNVPIPFIESETQSLLERVWNGGYIEAVRETLIGKNILIVVKEISKEYKKRMSQLYVKSVMVKEVPLLDFEERLALAEELMTRIAPFLPPSMSIEPLPVMAHKLESMISTITRLIDTMRTTVQNVR